MAVAGRAVDVAGFAGLVGLTIGGFEVTLLLLLGFAGLFVGFGVFSGLEGEGGDGFFVGVAAVPVAGVGLCVPAVGLTCP